jgi:hypothetical protein
LNYGVTRHNPTWLVLLGKDSVGNGSKGFSSRPPSKLSYGVTQHLWLTAKLPSGALPRLTWQREKRQLGYGAMRYNLTYLVEKLFGKLIVRLLNGHFCSYLLISKV